jgi:hypothetical protein
LARTQVRTSWRNASSSAVKNKSISDLQSRGW